MYGCFGGVARPFGADNVGFGADDPFQNFPRDASVVEGVVNEVEEPSPEPFVVDNRSILEIG